MPAKDPRLKAGVSKWRTLLLSALVLCLILGLSVLTFVVMTVAKTPSWTPGALSQLKQASIVYDKDSNVIAQLHAKENRLTATSDEIPALVKKTFVAVEDKRFYQHFGIDPFRILSSAFHDVVAQSAKEGASTITIQLARNAFIQNPYAKTLTRKIQEAALAIQLEHSYTKDEILTFYLNKIFLGESSYGIKAAAQTYFGKSLLNLDPGEVALLAGLPQAPSQYDPYVNPTDAKNRRTVVLGIMRDAGIIDSAQYAKYKDSPFSYVDTVRKTQGAAKKTSGSPVSYKYPYFVDYVIESLESDYNLSEDQIFNGGLKIYTTVDPRIQTAAEAAFADPANFPQSRPDTLIQGAMTVIDPATGAVRAMVGGRNYTPRGINRAWWSQRQPGSTIKPLVVYGPAIEQGRYFTGTVLDDMPVQFNAGNGKIWAPVDFDTESSGWKGLITMRYAVENSVNVYAVRLLNQIGVRTGWQFGKDCLGLPLKEQDKDNLSLALGTAQVSTLDMAAAYGVYANDGIRVTRHAVDKVLDPSGNLIVAPRIFKQRVMKETTAYIINNLLRGVVTEGTGTGAQIENWAVCGKTGTTSLDDTEYVGRSGNKDAWFAGYTSKYVGVVWMGYDRDPDGKHYLHHVYGGSYPAQIWRKVMTAALQPLPPQTVWPQPDGIVSGVIDTKSGLLPSSLTPPQFRATEIAPLGSFPTQISNVWVEKDVDAAHPDRLARPDTPQILNKVFLNIPNRDPSQPWPAGEAVYRAPTGYASASGIPDSSAPDPNAPVNSPPKSPPEDTQLPSPELGPAGYNGTDFSVTFPLTLPPGSENYTLVICFRRPGQTSTETCLPTGLTPMSTSVTIPLGKGAKAPVSGDYLFYAVFQDQSGTKTGPPSTTVKLRLGS